MVSTSIVEGVVPAVLLPRDASGAASWVDFQRNLEFLLDFAIAGVCVNGATGEYPFASADERANAIRIAREVVGSAKLVASGIGAACWRDTIAFGATSVECGADVLLVPAPLFFRYSPEDIYCFYAEAAARLEVPSLIYNLPAFTAGVDSGLALRLIDGKNGMAGIKDSSGELTILSALSDRSPICGVRLVGHDGVLAEAISKGLCDGTISGVAGVLPELTVALWRSRNAPGRQFAAIAEHLRYLLKMLAPWPVPWALKIIAECRGFGNATFSLPLSQRRMEQMSAFRSEFQDWWNSAGDDLSRLAKAA